MSRFAFPLALFVVLVLDCLYIGLGAPYKKFIDDEWRYVHYAENLLQGFYSPTPRVFLWNGPGYPLLLMPFAKAAWLDGARYLNALLHVGIVAYGYRALCVRMPARAALLGLVGFVVYLPFYPFLRMLHTEVLSAFLLMAFAYHALVVERGPVHQGLLVLYAALLALTKVLFGYALLAGLLVAGVLWLWKRTPRARSWTIAAALALALCAPYLVYTQALTGRVFYWSSAGANSLYWLTAPSPEEWGDWYHQGWVKKNALLRKHHKKIFDQASGLSANPRLPEQEQLFNLSTPEAADLFMAKAKRNIAKHPFKFMRNWLANLLRFFFDVPVTVRKTEVLNRYAVHHAILLGLSVWLCVRARRMRRFFDARWLPVGVFVLASLGVYSFSSATARFAVPYVPLWWLSLAWLYAVVREPAMNDQ